MANIGPGRPQNADDVQARVLKKSRVFSRDDGLSQTLGHLLNGLEEPSLDEKLADHLPVVGVDARHQTRLIVLQGIQRGQVLREIPENAGRPAATEHNGQQQADDGNLPPSPATARLLRLIE